MLSFLAVDHGYQVAYNVGYFFDLYNPFHVAYTSLYEYF